MILSMMKIPHFYKAKSRIGLKNPPIHSTKLNIGVEDGPDAILPESFLASFKSCKVGGFNFSLPEDIDPNQFYQVLASEIEIFKSLINDSLADGEIQVVIGGDHGITLPSVLATIQRIADIKSLGYIQFDSHGDINLSSSSSPTDNFHGMYVRPLVDQFDIPEIGVLVNQKLPVQNMLYIGNLDLDPGEEEFFRKHKIKKFNKQQIAKNENISFLQNFINSFRFLHVSFDIDGMDRKEAPASGIPADNGLFFKDILPLLKIISKHPDFSFDLVEVNPKRRGSPKTIKLAQEILKSVLV